MRYRHISCAPDGSFEPVQCMGKKCHCVNTQTGEVLRPVDHKTKDCSEGETELSASTMLYSCIDLY